MKERVKERTVCVLITFLTAALIAASVFRCLGGAIGTQPDETNFGGEWQLAWYYGYDAEGELVEFTADDARAADYALTITVDGHTCTAAVGGHTLTGATAGNEAAAADGRLTLLSRLYDAATLYVSVANGECPAATCLYTRDGTLPTFRDYYGNVTGSWSGAAAAAITLQYRGAFWGTLTVDGDVRTLGGSLTMLEDGALRTGLAVDSGGTAWIVLSMNDELTLTSLDGDAAEYVLTQIGTADRSPAPPALAERTWNGANGTLTIAWQHNYCCGGTLVCGGDAYDFAGAILADGRGMVLATATDADGRIVRLALVIGNAALTGCFAVILDGSGTAVRLYEADR